MKQSTRDQIEGTLHLVKGKVKEAAGRVTRNPHVELSGRAEAVAGKVQKKVGEIKKAFEK